MGRLWRSIPHLSVHWQVLTWILHNWMLSLAHRWGKDRYVVSVSLGGCKVGNGHFTVIHRWSFMLRGPSHSVALICYHNFCQLQQQESAFFNLEIVRLSNGAPDHELNFQNMEVTSNFATPCSKKLAMGLNSWKPQKTRVENSVCYVQPITPTRTLIFSSKCCNKELIQLSLYSNAKGSVNARCNIYNVTCISLASEW